MSKRAPLKSPTDSLLALALQRVSDLTCVWEGLLIRFIIFHPLDIPGAVLACSVSCRVTLGVGFRVVGSKV